METRPLDRLQFLLGEIAKQQLESPKRELDGVLERALAHCEEWIAAAESIPNPADARDALFVTMMSVIAAMVVQIEDAAGKGPHRHTPPSPSMGMAGPGV